MALALGAQNCVPLQWTKRLEQAAVLVAEDRLTNAQISETVGIAMRTLDYWKQHPDFAQRVAEHVERFAEVTLRRGIARRERRVAALDDRWNRLQRVIEERAEDPGVADEPGGRTGLIVRTEKQVGKATAVEYAVDTGLLKELREHEKQAAQELGQWAEKHEHTGGDGKPLIFTIAIDRRDDPDADGDS